MLLFLEDRRPALDTRVGRRFEAGSLGKALEAANRELLGRAALVWQRNDDGREACALGTRFLHRECVYRYR